MLDATIYRKLLLIVRELHLMGYELIRICPCMSPSGLHWRCTVDSADRFSKINGAIIDNGSDEPASYTSGWEENYFGWEDIKDTTPKALANMFIERFPEIANRGRGSDSAYIEWYRKMLDLTHPNSLPIAYSDWNPPCDHLSVINSEKAITIPLPPPGSAGSI